MGLLAAIAGMLKPEAPPDAATQAALARISELVDPILKSAHAFDHHLAAPVHHALGYCEGLVAGLPGPIHIDRKSFSTDPLVHALFATADDIGHMLGKSQAVRDYLAESESWSADHFYALLAARRQEKHQFCVEIEVGVLHNDVPQTVLYFSDQTLVEPHADLGDTLAALRQRAFDSLLTAFHTHIEALRLEREGTRADTSVERSHLTILRGKTPGPEYAVHTRRLAELETKLRAIGESLMPDPLADALAAFLVAPESSLYMNPVSLRINRLGIVADPNEAVESDVTTINFPELVGRDQRRHMVVLARIDREEARQAVEAARDLQRRFLII